MKLFNKIKQEIYDLVARNEMSGKELKAWKKFLIKFYEYRIKREFQKKIEKNGIKSVIDDLINDIDKIYGDREPSIEVSYAGIDKQTGEETFDVILPGWLRKLT